MLPVAARLRRPEDFRRVLRRGARSGRRRLVLHVLAPAPGAEPAPSRAGLVVSKAVGNSVVRHRVSRRLRHVVAERLGTLPLGSSLVIRALPPAADASSAELSADLRGALRRLGLVAEHPSAASPDGRARPAVRPGMSDDGSTV